MKSNITKVLVKRILNEGARWPWEIQGLGMLRLRLALEVRLHIWHSGLVYYSRPSQIHNHPWDFDSHIVVGQLKNTVYCKSSFGKPNHNIGTIVCGVGGSMAPENVEQACLILHYEKQYGEGDSYSLSADDFHTTSFKDGTTTLIERRFRLDTERAQVAYPIDEKWKSAEPRPASVAEIELAVGAALELF